MLYKGKVYRRCLKISRSVSSNQRQLLKKPGLEQSISKLMFHSILIYSSIYLKINYSRNNKWKALRIMIQLEIVFISYVGCKKSIIVKAAIVSATLSVQRKYRWENPCKCLYNFRRKKNIFTNSSSNKCELLGSLMAGQVTLISKLPLTSPSSHNFPSTRCWTSFLIKLSVCLSYSHIKYLLFYIQHPPTHYHAKKVKKVK